MRVLFLTDGTPGPRLGGGPRRTHQMLHELMAFFGAENVTLISSEELLQPVKPVRRLLDRAIVRWKNTTANPFQALSSDRYGIQRFPATGLDRYIEMVEFLGGAGLCVLEGFGLVSLAEVNNRLGIRTVLAPRAVEALTNNLSSIVSAFRAMSCHAATRRHRLHVRSAFTSFANELIGSAGMTRTWLLSRLEDGVFKALGLASAYLPYYPVGEAEECLRAIRRTRRVERGLFVISGGSNDQNRLALEAFLQNLRQETIPSGARIAIVGLNSLPESWTHHLPYRVQFLGRLPEAEFDALLGRAQAVVIPQICGFGCMTRVADMLCAGIPIVAGAIVASGTGHVPGVIYVPDAPGAWRSALRAAMGLPEVFSDAGFSSWREAQRVIVRDEFARVTAC